MYQGSSDTPIDWADGCKPKAVIHPDGSITSEDEVIFPPVRGLSEGDILPKVICSPEQTGGGIGGFSLFL